MNHSLKLQTHNLLTDDVENTNCENSGGDLVRRRLIPENLKDARREQEEQETYHTLINVPSKRVKREAKI